MSIDDNDLETGTVAPTSTEEAPTAPLSLRDQITAATKEHSSEPSDAPKSDSRTPVERARDASGKFAPKPEGQVAKPTEAQAPAQTQTTQPVATRQAPSSWSDGNKAAFNTLPPAIQDEVLKRESDVNKGFEERAARVRVADDWDRITAPYAQLMQQLGTNPQQAFGKLLEWDGHLRNDPHTAVAALIRVYGADPSKVAAALQAQSRNPQPQQQIDPRQVSQMVSQQVQQALQERSTQQTIEQFAQDPSRPHFETLRTTMQMLLERGQATDLASAYDAAAWLNPEIRKQLIAEQAASQAAGNQDRAAAGQAVVARARSAAGSVKGAPGGVAEAKSGPKAGASLREHLNYAMEQNS